MQPVGKWRVEEPPEEALVQPVGKWTIDTRDTDTFTAHMEANFKEEPEAIEEPDIAANVGDLLRPHLEQAEGNKTEVYQGAKDKEGVLTAGVGHKLTAAELKKFGKGDTIPPEQIQTWYDQDSKKAIGAAVKQAKEIGVESQEFMSALASVNFQLGTNWKGEHKKTWKLMKAGKFKEAATEAASSDWHGQTPERVEAFQEALLKVADELEYSDMEDGWYRDKETKEEFQVVDGRRA